VTTYPVYLGDLDKVLAPFVTDDVTDDALDTKLRRFWIAIDRMLPDAFVHLDLGPHDSRITRSILRVERSLRQAVPNITLKVDPAITPDDLDRGRRAHRVRDRQAALRQPPDDGRRPRRALRRGELLQLAEDRRRRPHPRADEPQGGGAPPRHRRRLVDDFLATTLPHYVELTAELAEARIRSLVEEQHFFESHWLAAGGAHRHRPLLGDVRHLRLAECVNLLMQARASTVATATTMPQTR
jgi:hypothetical protein